MNATVNAQKDFLAAVPGAAAVNVTINAQNDVAVNTSQPLANLLTGHFNDTCPVGSGQKRLGKRIMTDFDVGCVENSVYSLAKYIASNSAMQKDLSSIPSNFNVKGHLNNVVSQVNVRVRQQPQLFSGSIFSPMAIFSTLSYLTSLAYIVWKYGPGTEITQIVIPYADISEADSPSTCTSWTFSFTSPTPFSTVVVSQILLLTYIRVDLLSAGLALRGNPDGNSLRGAQPIQPSSRYEFVQHDDDCTHLLANYDFHGGFQ